MTDITLEQRARLMFAGHLRANGYACGAEAIELGRHSPYDRAALGAIAEALEAALRLSAGVDSARLDALEALVDSQPDKALLLHHGQHGINGRYAGLGLSNTRRTLREAIDAAAPRHEPGEG